MATDVSTTQAALARIFFTRTTTACELKQWCEMLIRVVDAINGEAGPAYMALRPGARFGVFEMWGEQLRRRAGALTPASFMRELHETDGMVLGQLLQNLKLVVKWCDAQEQVGTAAPRPVAAGANSSLVEGDGHAGAAEVPAEFRYLEKPDGEVLTPMAIASNPELAISGSTLSKNFGEGKPLTKRIPLGKGYAYSYKEVAALRHSMTSRDESRH